MSDTNRTKLAFIAETTYGEQKTGSNLQLLRLTSDSLARSVTPSVSGEIRSNRRVANVRNTNAQVSGSIGFELSYGTFDDLMAAALLDSAWSTATTVVSAGTVSAVDSTNKFTISTSWTATPAVGSWIKVSGFTGSYTGNNGLWKVSAASSTEITVTGGTVVNATSQTSITITQGAAAVDGTTLATFNFERIYDDLSNTLTLFKGCAINGFSLNVPVTGFITGSFDIIGSDAEGLSSSGGAGYTAISTTTPMEATEVVSLLENQTSMGITAFSLALNNNLRIKREVPTGITGIGTGQIDLSGTLTAYFASNTLWNKFANETESSIALNLQDAAGNAYVLDIPRIKYTGGGAPVTGPNNDVTVDLNWTAYEHSTESVCFSITRFPAA